MRVDKNIKNAKTATKFPTSIILITVWMGYLAFRGLGKIFDFNRFSLNKSILGFELAIFNYVMDILIFVFLIVLIFMFVKRKKNSWKYFIILIILMVLGSLVGLFFVDEMMLLLEFESVTQMEFVKVFTYITSTITLLFYLFLGFLVYKKRNYFKK